ncbi:hypothetical protein B0H17DRAFT_1124683 [Mycena rosella]|uniref:Uncharacterized protein n=1 Tax=Mycena rosella TaxID=1033263 RepID=A0AAD7MAZ8_MYCRO|nr:hypothetical protein B0H17DRAFT_1124683 [Mycena rosella]
MEKVYTVLGGSIPGVFNHPEPEVKAALGLQLNLEKIAELQPKLSAEMIAASAEIAVCISPETFRILYKEQVPKPQNLRGKLSSFGGGGCHKGTCHSMMLPVEVEYRLNGKFVNQHWTRSMRTMTHYYFDVNGRTVNIKVVMRHSSHGHGCLISGCTASQAVARG